MMADRFYLGVDVGTGSARAGIFDAHGVRAGFGVHPLQRWEPEADFHEQSSDDIWDACGKAIRTALKESDIAPEAIRGIGFDATCSLVVLDEGGRPMTISPSNDPARNVILWSDHRAIDQAVRINAGEHAALRSVGGALSPEMQVPKLLWLKEHLPYTWQRAAHFLDLADFLSYRATGCGVRSMCTTTCKWNYRTQAGCWDDDFFAAIGLEGLTGAGHVRIGERVRSQGERAGNLSRDAAAELGLADKTPVAVSIIDAHAGGLGVLGIGLGHDELHRLDRRMALICGSSTCHMASSREPRFVPGVWGPYYSGMIPGMWLAEGGQSATGTLIDHLIYQHALGPELRARERSEGLTAYAILNTRLMQLAQRVNFPAQLTRDIHVYPDFHGNRSPLADPTLRGMMCGLTLDSSLDALAIQYLAVIQALAQGTRQILERLNNHGYEIDVLVACGGGAKNEWYLREHADVTGCTVLLPEEPEAMPLGAAMLGAVACGDQRSLQSAMVSMSRLRRAIEPSRGLIAEYHQVKWEIHQLMLQHQRTYAGLMREHLTASSALRPDRA